MNLTYLLGQSQALRVGDRSQLLFLQLLNRFLLVPEIQLGAYQDDGRGGAVMANLRVPLGGRRYNHTQIQLDVSERVSGALLGKSSYQPQ